MIEGFDYKVVLLPISLILAGILLGGLAGYHIGKKHSNSVGSKRKINLDDVMLRISGIVTFASIILIAFGVLEKIAIIGINTFGTMVFSWILTKRSAKDDFKEHEQELALKSYRHINYIDTAANTAYSVIEGYADEVKDNETKLILGRAMDHIGYIQGGISTCKLDWHDMLSDYDKNEYKKSAKNACDSDDFGVIKINIPTEQINQEEA